jgi:hypothetical protein
LFYIIQYNTPVAAQYSGKSGPKKASIAERAPEKGIAVQYNWTLYAIELDVLVYSTGSTIKYQALGRVRVCSCLWQFHTISELFEAILDTLSVWVIEREDR